MKKTASVLLMCAIASASAQEPANLYPEGNFEGAVELQAPHPSPLTGDPLTAQEGILYIEPGDYKSKKCSVSVENENGSNFIRYVAPVGFTGILRTYIALKLPDPAPATLTISMRWRVSDYATQDNAPEWASAQNDPMFVLADGTKKILYGTLRLKSNTEEWQEVEKTVSVPEGAKMLILQPGLYCVTGTLDVDDIKVTAE
jgi:hypothetical protein